MNGAKLLSPRPDVEELPGRHVVAVVVLGVLVAAPLLLVVLPLGPEATAGPPGVIALNWCVIVYASVRIAAFAWHGRPRWADALFWAFSYVWLGLASLAQNSSGLNPMSTPLSTRQQVVQLLVILVGFAAFDLGQRWRRAPLGPRRPGAGIRMLSRGRVVALGVITIALSPVLVHALGGLSALFGNRQAILDHLEATSFYTNNSMAAGGALTVVANVLPFASVLGVLCLWRSQSALRRDPVLVALFLALIPVNVVLNNPISNPRYWFFAMGIAVVLTLRIMLRPAAMISLVMLFVTAATLVFPYSDAFRTDEVGLQNATRSTSQPVDYLVGKTDYGAVTDVGYAVRYVEEEGHTWGKQLLGAATFWIPRAWWSDKPVNTAEILADQIRFPNRYLDTPLWAEGYLDFGFAGTAGALLLFGALARRADDAIERASHESHGYRAVAFPIAVSFVGYESFLLRGSILQAMFKIAFLVAVLAVLGRRVPVGPADDERPTRRPVPSEAVP